MLLLSKHTPQCGFAPPKPARGPVDAVGCNAMHIQACWHRCSALAATAAGFSCPSTVLAHCLLLDELSQNLELPCSAEAAARPACKPSCAKAKRPTNSEGSSYCVLILWFPWHSVGASSRQMLADPTVRFPLFPFSSLPPLYPCKRRFPLA